MQHQYEASKWLGHAGPPGNLRGAQSGAAHRHEWDTRGIPTVSLNCLRSGTSDGFGRVECGVILTRLTLFRKGQRASCSVGTSPPRSEARTPSSPESLTPVGLDVGYGSLRRTRSWRWQRGIARRAVMKEGTGGAPC